MVRFLVWWLRRRVFQGWPLSGVLLALTATGCEGETAPVRYDLTGTWFRAAGLADGDKCFPQEQRNHEITGNYWTVTRGAQGITATDDGGCTLSVAETGPGILEANGETCSLEEGKPLALLGINRRYVRFRLDTVKQTFAAGIFDTYLTNTGEVSGCGLIEAKTTAVAP